MSARLPREGPPQGRVKHFALCRQAEKPECLSVGEIEAVEFYPRGLPEIEFDAAVSYATVAVG